LAACLDGSIGRDPGQVTVPELAQHGPRHLVRLGQQHERGALLVAVVVLGGVLGVGDEVGDSPPELSVPGPR